MDQESILLSRIADTSETIARLGAIIRDLQVEVATDEKKLRVLRDKKI